MYITRENRYISFAPPIKDKSLTSPHPHPLLQQIQGFGGDARRDAEEKRRVARGENLFAGGPVVRVGAKEPAAQEPTRPGESCQVLKD